MARTVQIGTRGALASLAAIAAFLVSMGVIHATWIMPRVLSESRDQTRAMIEAHTEQPHPVSVSQREFERLITQMSSIDRRLAQIEAKI